MSISIRIYSEKACLMSEVLAVLCYSHNPNPNPNPKTNANNIPNRFTVQISH